MILRAFRTGFVLIFLFSPLGLFPQTAGAQPAPGTAGKETIGVSLRRVGRLPGLVTKGAFVGVVCFRSALSEEGVYYDSSDMEVVAEDKYGGKTVRTVRPKGPGRLVRWPRTGRHQGVFVVDGEVTLVQTLGGKAPIMGKVEKAVGDLQRYYNPVRSRDEPLRDLERVFSGHPDTVGAVQTFLVVGSPEAKHVLDCTFLGPIGEQEIPYIRPVVKVLLAGKGEAPAEEARKFLADSNPAMAMLGLARLDALRQTTLEDYATALAHVALPYVQEIFLGANHHVWGKESLREQWPQALRAVFDKAEPERRSAILDAVRAYVARGSSDLVRNLRKVFPELETPKPEADNTDM